MENGSSMTIGEYLVESRNARRLTVSEVSQALHIREEYVEALEHDEWDKLPGEVYGRGFLKSYARYLDLDAEALTDYRKRLSAKESDVTPVAPTAVPTTTRRERHAASRPRQRHQKRASSAVPSRHREDRSSPLDSGRTVAGVAIVLVILFVAGIISLHHSGKATATTAKPTSSGLATRTKKTTQKKVPHHHHPATPVPSTSVTLVSNNGAQGTALYHDTGYPVTIQLTFTGLCWVRVTENGVTQNPSGVTYTSGQHLTVTATSGIALILGTRAVSMTVNNQSIALPDSPIYPLHLTVDHS